MTRLFDMEAGLMAEASASLSGPNPIPGQTAQDRQLSP